jgi:CRISPR-associated protein Csm2
METVAELKQRLQQAGTLTELLIPADFAGEEQVAAEIAREHQKDLKPTQTRRIFHTIKQIERRNRRETDDESLSDDDRLRLTLLAPELAYAVGRELIPREFYEALKLCLQSDKLKTVGDLRRLVQFISAVVAYQKFYK